MPHTPSAFKRMRQNAKRRIVNRSAKSTVKTALQKVTAAKGAEPAKLQPLLREAIRQLDKACASGVLHRNTAARRKSALMRLAAAKQP